MPLYRSSAESPVNPSPQGSASEPAPAAAPPAPPEPSAQPRWTGLTRGIDALLAVLIVALAGLLASFAVRNHEVWLHLATGRLIAKGQYSFGTDPFRSGEPLAWVNHAWLSDLVMYLAYQIHETVLLALKVLLVALTAVVMLATRRPGQPLWPGAVCAALALITAAPRLLLDPVLVSMVGLALTLRLTLRPMPQPPWLTPALLAGLFAVWVNADQWFLLGPAVVLVVVLVERIQGGNPESVVNRLSPGALLALAACLVGPHHLTALTVPPEWRSLSPEVRTEAVFKPVFLSPMDPGYFRQPYLGGNANGVAFLLLLLLGPLAFALNFRALRWSHLVVWLLAAGMALKLARALPFFAVVAAPLTAWNLAQGLHRWRERLVEKRQAPALRMADFLSVFGRVLTLLACIGLVLASFPGWLHPNPNDPVNSRPVAWRFEPDLSLIGSAHRLARWRERQNLPATARLFNLQPAAASYLVWYAAAPSGQPLEKPFFDARFGLGNAAEYLRLRAALMPLHLDDVSPPPDLNWAELGVTHLLLSEANPESMLVPQVAMRLLQSSQWQLWDSQGRAVLLGRVGAVASVPELDPVAQAFHAEAGTRLADRDLHPPPPSFWQALTSTRPGATAGAAASLLDRSMAILESRQPSPHQQQFQRLAFTARKVGLTLLVAAPGSFAAGSVILPSVVGDRMPMELPDAFQTRRAAWSVLAVRDARRAILTAPNDPDGWIRLAEAYDSFETVREFYGAVHMTALRRATETAPSVSELQRRGSRRIYFQLFRLRAIAHQRERHLDLALESFKQCLEHARNQPFDDVTPEQRKELMEGLYKQHDELEKVVRRAQEDYDIRSASRPPNERVQLALERGLIGEALIQLQQPELLNGPQGPHVIDLTLQLLLVSGDAERAARLLLDLPASNWPGPLQDNLRRYRVLAFLAVGDFTRAIDAQKTIVSIAGRYQRPASERRDLIVDVVSHLALPNPDLLHWSGYGRAAQLLAGNVQLTLLLQLLRDERIQAEETARLALLRLEQGDTEAAMADFQQANRGTGFPSLRMVRRYLLFMR